MVLITPATDQIRQKSPFLARNVADAIGLADRVHLRNRFSARLSNYNLLESLGVQELAKLFLSFTSVERVNEEVAEFNAAIYRCLDADKVGRLLELEFGASPQAPQGHAR